MKALAVLILAVITQAMLRPPQPEVPPHAPGTAAAGVFLSCARPLLARWAWYDFESSLGLGHLPRALEGLRLLLLLDPSDARVPLHLARFLAFTLTPREGTAPERMQRIFEAERVLERARARFPTDPHIPLLQGQLLQMDWAREPIPHRIWCRHHGGTPQQAAAAAFAQAARLAPGSARAVLLAGDAARWAAIESILNGDSGGWERMRAVVQTMRSAMHEAGPVLQRLTRGWDEIAQAMLAHDGAAAAGALLQTSGLEAPGEDAALPQEEAALVLAMVPAVAAEVTLHGNEDASRALSAIQALHTISARMQAPAQSDAHRALRELATRMVAVQPELRARVPAGLMEEK